MNKTKLSILLLIIAVILLFSSCGNMMVESDDISIDLTSVVSKDLTNLYAKIRLVAVGTNNFYELPEAEAFQPIKDGKVSLTNIPVGPDYTIYLSVGVLDGNIFKVSKAVNGDVSVTGGTTSAATLKVSAIMATPIDAFIGKSLNGAAFVDDKIYTIGVDDGKLHNATDRTSVSAAADFTFNSVTTGYDNYAIISMKNKDGIGFAKSTDISVDYTYCDDDPETVDENESLASAIEGDDKSIDIISADVFWDTNEELELVIGQTDGGLVLHVQDFTVEEEFKEWMVMDLGPYLEEAGLELTGKIIDSISVIKKYTDDTKTEVSALWVFMASQIGDFRIKLSLVEDGFDVEPEEGEDDLDAIMNLFEPFKKDNALEDRNILGMTTPGDNTLYVGTDQGLYKATATTDIVDMNPKVVAAAGKRVEMLSGGSSYTACVTALELIVLRNSDNATVSIPFNAGLPVAELLNGGAVTGMSWNGNVLYIAGNYGLSSIDVAKLFAK